MIIAGRSAGFPPPPPRASRRTRVWLSCPGSAARSSPSRRCGIRLSSGRKTDLRPSTTALLRRSLQAP
eukprot:1104680-Pyramimonas_sp.AAC.1